MFTLYSWSDSMRPATTTIWYWRALMLERGFRNNLIAGGAVWVWRRGRTCPGECEGSSTSRRIPQPPLSLPHNCSTPMMVRLWPGYGQSSWVGILQRKKNTKVHQEYLRWEAIYILIRNVWVCFLFNVPVLINANFDISIDTSTDPDAGGRWVA